MNFFSKDHPVIIAITSIFSLELVALTELDMLVKILFEIVVGTLTTIYLYNKNKNRNK